MRKKFEEKAISQRSTRKKHLSPVSNYQVNDFLYHCGPFIGEQKKADLRETKFVKGFIRKQQSEIKQDEDRNNLQKLREQKNILGQNSRREYLEKASYKSGYKNPITGELCSGVQNGEIRCEIPLLSKKNKFARKNDPEKLMHAEQKSKPEIRNERREKLIKTEGLVSTKKNYSMKEFFGSYESYGLNDGSNFDKRCKKGSC